MAAIPVAIQAQNLRSGQVFAEPLGTKITIENNVGIIQLQDFAVTRN